MTLRRNTLNVITIDFETAYTKDLGFKTQTTEQYLRDPRFEVIGVAVSVGGEKPMWFSGTNEEVRTWLSQFDMGNSMVVAHNAMFDMAILNWNFGIRPKVIADTLSMARAVHGTEVGNSLAKLADHYKIGVKGNEVLRVEGMFRKDFSSEDLARYGEYCCNDVALTHELFLYLLPQFRTVELKLIDVTVRMFTEPVLLLDMALLEQHLNDVVARKEKLLESAGALKADLMSNEKFADLLRGLGVDPPIKVSPTTGEETLALAKNDDGFKALADHPDDRVQALVAARLGAKSTLEETRTERLLGIAKRGAMPVPLSYYAAHTGRWGGSDKLNLQNLPSRAENAGKLKAAILAPDGHVIIDCDSSQIEARVLAWFAQQEDLVEVFRLNNKEILDGIEKKNFKHDPYKLMASAIYNKPIDEIDSQERFLGKTVTLGCGYGLGAARLKWSLSNGSPSVDLPIEECQRIIDVYRSKYPKIPELWDAGNNAISAMSKKKTAKWGNGVITIVKEGILLPNGMHQRYPEVKKVKDKEGKYSYVYKSRKGFTKIYGGKLTENICQALARCIIGEQLLRINRRYKVVLTVHDAVACVAPESEAEEAMAYVMECMRYVPSWADGIPLNCEAGYGKSYGDC